jgi:hypothetical protein
MALDIAALLDALEAMDPDARKAFHAAMRPTFEDMGCLDPPVLKRLLRQACIRLAAIRHTGEATEMHELIAFDLAVQRLYSGGEQ